ncbi:hypothetical protein WOLCODRAFT_164902 [Wolfiporia cocos MD-104 SS10]|uniref:Uncharacterized protein n=1 Tax=Wolfiporia cocos (strain MD-104) TaxID=742152 RepID=A0A2H3K6L2_WOLCO|nr:hypothetical protein WOLCODRAFT_164902 [Wolfiporia cocos MD-104 SS10]
MRTMDVPPGPDKIDSPTGPPRHKEPPSRKKHLPLYKRRTRRRDVVAARTATMLDAIGLVIVVYIFRVRGDGCLQNAGLLHSPSQRACCSAGPPTRSAGNAVKMFRQTVARPPPAPAATDAQRCCALSPDGLSDT